MSMVTDPWTSGHNKTVVKSPANGNETPSLAFEDDFTPLVRHSLPDSAEYLAILESRLRKLKSDPNVLRQLTEKREACMRQLLGEQTFSEPEALTLEQPVDDSPLLRAVAPHRQALTQGETVELVKHDHLATEE